MPITEMNKNDWFMDMNNKDYPIKEIVQYGSDE